MDQKILIMKFKRSRLPGFVFMTAVAAYTYAKLVRPWHLRWGATLEEACRPLPGDDLVAQPAMAATHAITIQAAVDQVWPWLAQIGQGRGGFYSYDWLENRFGMDIHNVERIQPELQNPKVGDLIPFWKGIGIPIVQIEPPALLVLAGSFAPGQPTGGSWTFKLEAPEPQTTRLIVRARVAGFEPGWLSVILYRFFLEPAHFIMERGMLLGIKTRAENLGSR
jgi:hypothetical protein